MLMKNLRLAAALGTLFLERVRNVDLQDIKVTEKPPKAVFKMPGLGLDCYNQYGHPKSHKILLSTTAAKVHLFHTPYNANGDVFLDWETITTDRMSFISSLTANFAKCLYLPKNNQKIFNGEIQLKSVGNSSLAVSTALYLPGDKWAFSSIAQAVMVDKVKRRPTPLPEWFKNKYSDQARSNSLVIPVFKRPDGKFIYETKVRFSDTDAYNHTSFASYIMFAEDAIHAGLAADHADFHDISENIVANGVRTLQVTYQQESVENDLLTCHVWRDYGEDAETVVRCSIEKDNKIVCQLLFEYYPED